MMLASVGSAAANFVKSRYLSKSLHADDVSWFNTPAREQEMALETEIAAYERLRDELAKHYQGKFVVFHGEDFIGSFDTLDNAAAEAVRRFGRGPYLIRQVGRPPITLPASVLYRPVVDLADR
jgi:hypothetical protein